MTAHWDRYLLDSQTFGNPVDIVRKSKTKKGFTLSQFVKDRLLGNYNALAEYARKYYPIKKYLPSNYFDIKKGSLDYEYEEGIRLSKRAYPRVLAIEKSVNYPKLKDYYMWFFFA